MPLKLKVKHQNNTSILVWYLSEELDFFLNELELDNKQKELLNGFSDKRKIEWLSARYLLKISYPEFTVDKLYKDSYGKPFIKASNRFLSISHSHQYAALIISDKVVGIDIQKIHENIERISHKFISDKELTYTRNSDQILHMHINWGAKESMYKGYGKKELGFIRHMSIDPYNLKVGTTFFKGYVNKDDINETYSLYTKSINNYVLVYAIKD